VNHIFQILWNFASASAAADVFAADASVDTDFFHSLVGVVVVCEFFLSVVDVVAKALEIQ